MDTKTARALKERFLDWSGGCPPDSEHEITVYIDYVHGSDADDANEVRKMLRDWMEEQNFIESQGETTR